MTQKLNDFLLDVKEDIAELYYLFKNILNIFKNWYKWYKIINQTKYYDYIYSIEVFKTHLQYTADYLESNKANTTNSKTHAKKIRTIIKLMDLVYDNYYEYEYFNQLKEKYGPIEYKFIPTGDKLFKFETTYPKQPKEKWDEITKEYSLAREKGEIKQNKAHRILWALVEHNIRKTWD
jgi:hypothetical protein